MNQSHSKSRTRGAAVAVALAGAVTGLCAAITVDAASSSDHRTPSLQLIGFARTNQLSGLSPASLRPIDVREVTYPELAEFARQNGLTGLSPASLAPLESGARHRFAPAADRWFDSDDRLALPPTPATTLLDRVR